MGNDDHGHSTRLVDLAGQEYLVEELGQLFEVAAGGMVGYGADLNALFRRAASYVDRILKGANPAEMPIEQPTKFFLAVNLKTAKALGITIPPPILLRATQVIE